MLDAGGRSRTLSDDAAHPATGGAGALPARRTGAPLPRFAGPWARSAEEVGDCWRVLGGLVSRFARGVAADPGRPAEELSYGERYLLGAHAAARWTLGLTTRAPLTGQEAVPDEHRIAIELAYADGCLAARGVLGDPAAGVRAWLAWLTGRADTMVFHAL